MNVKEIMSGNVVGTYEEHQLSPTQKNMAVATILHRGAGVYIQQALLDLKGNIDLSLLREAWIRLTNRHAMLRTSIHLDTENEPVLRIWERCDTDFKEEVLPNTGITAEDEFDQFLDRDRSEAFDMAVAPLARVRVINREERNYRVVITYHHSVIDGPSRRVLIREFLQIYESLCSGEELGLKEPIPYRGFGSWLEADDTASHDAYWEGQIAIAEGACDVPGDRINPKSELRGDISHQVLDFVYSEDDQAKLNEYSEQEGARIPMLVISAWCVLLGRYNDRDKATFGLIRAGRSRPETDCSDIVGSLISAIPVGVDLSVSRSCQDILKRTKSLVRETRNYEHTDLTQIKKALNISQEQSLFNTILVINRSTDDYDLSTSNNYYQAKNFRVIERPDVPIFLQIYTEPQLQLRLYYDREQYSGEFAEGVLRHFRNILLAFCNAEAEWRQLAILDELERERVVGEWNATEKMYDRSQTINQIFESQVNQTPDAVAVEDADRRLTYRELNERANQLARHLIKQEIGADRLVGVYVDRSTDMLVSIIGVLKSGGAYIPLDPTYPKDRIGYMIEDSSTQLVITQSSLLQEISGSNTVKQILCIDQDWPEIDAEDNKDLVLNISPNQLAYVIYTSGSTGRPKGVMVEHHNVVNFFAGMDDRINHDSGGVWLAVTSLSFDISVLELLYTIGRGFKVVLYGQSQQVAENSKQTIGQLIRDHKVTHMQCTPSMLSLILMSDDDRAALSELGTLMVGGEALPISLAQELTNVTSADVLNMYGPTETTIWSSTARIDLKEPMISIGRPIANTQFYILDTNLQLLPPGIPGNLYIGGDGVVRGYLNRPDITQERFINNPAVAEGNNRIYQTGDLASWTLEGRVNYLGRADNQVKIRGYRIELGEIEVRLAENEAVREAVVVAHTHSPGDIRLIAYVIAAKDQSIDTNALQNNLRQSLPDYMVPSQYVNIDAFPLTPNKKIDRKALLSRADRPAPPENKKSAPQSKPAGKANTVLNIYEKFFYGEGIDINDKSSFVSLGGDSLNYVRLSMVLEKHLGSLPGNWDKLSISELESQKKSVSKLSKIETSTLFRALAITAVVVLHSGVKWVGGGLILLVMMVGLNFARFQSAKLISGEVWGTFWSYFKKILIPYFVLTIAYMLWRREWDWSILAFYGNLIPIAEQQKAIFAAWFIQLLFQCLLIIALMFSFKGIRSAFTSNEWKASIIVLVVFIGLNFIFPYIYDTNYLYQRVPTHYLAFIWLGWCIVFAETKRQKAIILLSALALWCINWDISWSMLLFVLPVAILLTIPYFYVPRIIKVTIEVIASATFYIFLFHMAFIHIPRHVFQLNYPLLNILVGLGGSIAVWWFFEGFSTSKKVRKILDNVSRQRT